MKKGGNGGANTNANGLKFENKTDLATSIYDDLSDKYKLKQHEFKADTKLPFKNSSSLVYDVYRKADNKLIGVLTKQNQFYNVLFDSYGLENANHKAWKPDEASSTLQRTRSSLLRKSGNQRLAVLTRRYLVSSINDGCTRMISIRLKTNPSPQYNLWHSLTRHGGLMVTMARMVKTIKTILTRCEKTV